MALALVALAFLCGSVPFGWLAARARGVDVRAVGSGNIGAANVARNVGKRVGLVVLLLDALKGALPVSLALQLAPEVAVLPRLAHAVGAAAVLGHCFTPWLRGRGGKGVATSLGVLLVLAPAVVGVAAGAFLAVFAWRRIVSLGALVAVVSLPFAAIALGRPSFEVGYVCALGGLVMLLHRDNLARLRAGTEGPLV